MTRATDGSVPVSIEEFIEDEITKLRTKAGALARLGPVGESLAAAFAEAATEIQTDFQAWWLTKLSVNDAAAESGYSPERLREMARDRVLPHQKGGGAKGSITIARCDLPRRPKAKPDDNISSLADRLLRGAPVAGQS